VAKTIKSPAPEDVTIPNWPESSWFDVFGLSLVRPPVPPPT
jgi:hypothetical protein